MKLFGAMVVVEFEENSGACLAIVFNIWLVPRKKEVFWPPYQENAQYLRTLKKGENFNSETFLEFSMKMVCHFL